jgi:hypothetical protein
MQARSEAPLPVRLPATPSADRAGTCMRHGNDRVRINASLFQGGTKYRVLSRIKGWIDHELNQARKAVSCIQRT